MNAPNLTYSEQWYRAAQNWVDLDSAANLLEETKSAVLSQKMSKLGDIPVSRAETHVKASDEWHRHIESIVKARSAANKAKVEMEYLKMKFMENNSAEATARVQAKL